MEKDTLVFKCSDIMVQIVSTVRDTIILIFLIKKKVFFCPFFLFQMLFQTGNTELCKMQTIRKKSI